MMPSAHLLSGIRFYHPKKQSGRDAYSHNTALLPAKTFYPDLTNPDGNGTTVAIRHRVKEQ
jgi:hypothetical protein